MALVVAAFRQDATLRGTLFDELFAHVMPYQARRAEGQRRNGGCVEESEDARVNMGGAGAVNSAGTGMLSCNFLISPTPLLPPPDTCPLIGWQQARAA